MRILIVTAHYHPFFHPRAHRWTALARYWAEQGHEVHVVTARVRGFRKFSVQDGVTLHRTGFSSLKEIFYYFTGAKDGTGRVGAPIHKPGWAIRGLMWVYENIWKRLFFPDDACVWYFPARKKSLELLTQQPFDAWITVSLPFTGHLVGLFLKRRFPDLRWVADTGDPFAAQPVAMNNAFLFGRLNLRLEKRVLEQADSFSVTTPATLRHYQKIFGPEVTRKIVVIPPLLHPAPARATRMIRKEDDPVKIGYFGALYPPIRTPEAFLHLLREACLSEPGLPSRLEIHFYGEVKPELLQILHAEPMVRLHGLQDRPTVRQAMQEMDALLHIGNRAGAQLPSKAVEYLASGKPVLHLSYMDPDPLIEFWGDHPDLFVLKMTSEAPVRQFTDWLRQIKNTKETDVPPARRMPFLLESIANQYEKILRIVS